MDDNREGCFPESYVQPADAVNTDETMVQQQQPRVDGGELAAVQAPLVPTLLLILAAFLSGLNCVRVQSNLCFIMFFLGGSTKLPMIQLFCAAHLCLCFFVIVICLIFCTCCLRTCGSLVCSF